MSEELKPVRCGCGGEAKLQAVFKIKKDSWIYQVGCKECFIQTIGFPSESEAVEAWNRAMSAKDTNVLDKIATDNNVGGKKFVKIYLCGDCGFYNWKKHKCSRGAHEKGKPQDKFYLDCPLGICEEEINENDLISREAAFEALWKVNSSEDMLFVDAVVDTLENIPSAEPEHAKVEKLELKNTSHEVWKCGNCGQYMHRSSWARAVNYCSYCGARLEWE